MLKIEIQLIYKQIIRYLFISFHIIKVSQLNITSITFKAHYICITFRVLDYKNYVHPIENISQLTCAIF